MSIESTLSHRVCVRCGTDNELDADICVSCSFNLTSDLQKDYDRYRAQTLGSFTEAASAETEEEASPAQSVELEADDPEDEEEASPAQSVELEADDPEDEEEASPAQSVELEADDPEESQNDSDSDDRAQDDETVISTSAMEDVEMVQADPEDDSVEAEADIDSFSSQEDSSIADDEDSIADDGDDEELASPEDGADQEDIDIDDSAVEEEAEEATVMLEPISEDGDSSVDDTPMEEQETVEQPEEDEDNAPPPPIGSGVVQVKSASPWMLATKRSSAFSAPKIRARARGQSSGNYNVEKSSLVQQPAFLETVSSFGPVHGNIRQGTTTFVDASRRGFRRNRGPMDNIPWATVIRSGLAIAVLLGLLYFLFGRGG